MPIDSVAGFVGVIREHELLEAAPLKELLAESRQQGDLRTLAQLAVKKGWLTPYQVNQVVSGQAASLVVGQYRILARLGEGGMGQVFKARHQTMGRIVALKVIRKDRLENEKAILRFQREIRIAAQLVHPNIVHAYDAASIAGLHFFVMEYVDGIDLARLVKEKGPLPIAHACDCIRQAAVGLAYAHDKGLIHRDIKPSNLLLARKPPEIPGGNAAGSPGTVKILDLGLARVAFGDDEATGASLSQEGSVLGTPDYMSPEQANNSARVDGRADIYSLGCTLYFLLTGQPPFPGNSNLEKLIKHQLEEPVPVEKLRPDVPPPLRTILRRMMAKRPEDRMSASEVAEALAPFASAAGASRSAGTGLRIAPAPTGSRTFTLTSLLPPTLRQKPRLTLAVTASGSLFLLTACLLFPVLLWRFSSGSSGSTSPVVSTPVKSTAAGPVHPPVTRYLPDNASYVWIYNTREVLQSPAYLQNEITMKQTLAVLSTALLLYGVDLFKHVDRTSRFVQEDPRGGEEVYCFVFQGTFDRSRFDQGTREGIPRPAAVRQVKGVPGGLYYQYIPNPGFRRSTYVAMPENNVLIYTNEERYAIEMWQKVSGQKQAVLLDRDLHEVLQDIDRKPQVFLAVGGSFSRGGRTLNSEHGIRFLTCGFEVGSDVQAEYTVTLRDAAAAQKFRSGSRQFFSNFFAFLGDSGVLTTGLNNAQPSFNDANHSVTYRVRYGSNDILRLMSR